MSSALEKGSHEFEFTFRDFEFLRRLSTEHTGIVVPDDKFNMFYARLSRRVRALGLGSFGEYCRFLAENPDAEHSAFINSITTNLTSFFRESHHFDYLAETLIPVWRRTNSASRKIRIWSAGCSTGEEAYSIAMVVLDNFPNPDTWDIRVLATDIDSDVLGVARRGVYPADSIKSLEKTRLQSWFLRGRGSQAGNIRVTEPLKHLVTFKPLNLMGRWPMRGTFDAIFCRNVLIYFDAETKCALAGRFSDLLVPGGHLFIGHSESLTGCTGPLESIGHTIYQKRTGS